MILKEQVAELLSLERDAIISIIYESPFVVPDKKIKDKVMQIQKLLYEMLNKQTKQKKLSYLESVYQKIYNEILKQKQLIMESFNPSTLKTMFIFYVVNDSLQNARLTEKSYLMLKSKHHAKTLLIENLLLPITIMNDQKLNKDINFNEKLNVFRKLIAELVVETS